jgi:hypothetical protein
MGLPSHCWDEYSAREEHGRERRFAQSEVGIFDVEPQAMISSLLESIADYHVKRRSEVSVDANKAESILLELRHRKKGRSPVILSMVGMQQIMDHAIDVTFSLRESVPRRAQNLLSCYCLISELIKDFSSQPLSRSDCWNLTRMGV